MSRRWPSGLMLLAACVRGDPHTVAPPAAEGELRPAAAFDGIRQKPARSAALFEEMARVFQHPRCANCHPTDDRPRQGMAQVIHDPPVWRGPDGHGAAGSHCDTCHQEANSTVSRVPGAEGWHLAPVEMAWLGRSPAEICDQLKDPARNGQRSLEDLHTHLSEDPLVAWGWSPGTDRAPAPGTQAQLAALTRAWIDTGAHCPTEAP